jgi:hypothetical protein
VQKQEEVKETKNNKPVPDQLDEDELYEEKPKVTVG